MEAVQLPAIRPSISGTRGKCGGRGGDVGSELTGNYHKVSEVAKAITGLNPRDFLGRIALCYDEMLQLALRRSQNKLDSGLEAQGPCVDASLSIRSRQLVYAHEASSQSCAMSKWEGVKRTLSAMVIPAFMSMNPFVLPLFILSTTWYLSSQFAPIVASRSSSSALPYSPRQNSRKDRQTCR